MAKKFGSKPYAQLFLADDAEYSHPEGTNASRGLHEGYDIGSIIFLKAEFMSHQKW